MIKVLKNDEYGHVSWFRNNEYGFVLNYFEGPDPFYNILHKSGCRTVRRTNDEGSRTVIEKICSENLKVFEGDATRHRGSMADWIS